MRKIKPIPLILVNSSGKVIRSFSWEESSIVLAVRKKTGRLEALSKASGERYKKSDFQVLARINLAEMGRKKVSVPKIGYIKKLAAGEEIEYDSSPIEQEGNEDFEKSLKWSSIIHASILLLAFLTYWTHSLFIEPEAPVVKLTKPQKVIKAVKTQPRKVVKASNKKIDRKKKVVKKRVRKAPPKKVRRARKKSVNQMGALAALGGTSNGSKSGKGLKLKSASRNSGSGDSQGRKSLGQANTSFAGKALSAPNGGNGKTRLGGVGYGTKGRSGGQAGYGKLNIGGSAGGGYVHPLQEEGTVNGGLEMSQIEAVIRKNIGQIYYCYEKGLQASSGLSGRVAVNFIINGGGRVRLAQIGQSSLGSSTVEKCMIRKIKQWRFPKPHGNVDVNVSYPFILRRAKHG